MTSRGITKNSHYALATTEYRQLGKVEKAVKLIEDQACSYREASSLVKISHSSVARGLIAKGKGRTIGKNGRPNKLNVDEMEAFIEIAHQYIEQHLEINYDTAQRLVIISFTQYIAF
jgi:transposase